MKVLYARTYIYVVTFCTIGGDRQQGCSIRISDQFMPSNAVSSRSCSSKCDMGVDQAQCRPGRGSTATDDSRIPRQLRFSGSEVNSGWPRRLLLGTAILTHSICSSDSICFCHLEAAHFDCGRISRQVFSATFCHHCDLSFFRLLITSSTGARSP